MEEWRCFLCGGKVMWKNDFMFEEIGMEDDGIVHFCECSKCGAEYEVYEAFKAQEEKSANDDSVYSITLQSVIRCLTKYYTVVIANDDSRYEDQTIIPQSKLCRKVLTMDFFEDCGEGEILWVHLSDRLDGTEVESE